MDERDRKIDQIDATLTRFSAVHDEMAQEERKRRSRLQRFLPKAWLDDELDMEAEPPPQENKRRRGGTTFGKSLALLFVLFVLSASGYGWRTQQQLDQQIKQVAALDLNSSAITDKIGQAGAENFLLVGANTKAGPQTAANTSTPTSAASDTVLVAHVTASRRNVVVVSFPPDLQVDVPECQGWDATSGVYTNTTVKAEPQATISKAYANGGPKCVTKTIQQLSGLAINHFIGINYQGLQAMVDAMHGVLVCADKQMQDSVLGSVLTQAGKQTVSGGVAVKYIQASHVVGDPNPDLNKIARQQWFVSSLLSKAMSSQVLLNPLEFNAVLSAFAKSTSADNITVSQLMTLAQSLQGSNSTRTSFVTVPTAGTPNDLGNQTLRADDARALFQSIIQGTPIPATAATFQPPPSNKPAPQPVRPANIKIQVLNGGKPGSAANTATALRNIGFDVVAFGAAPQPTDHTVIKYSAPNAAAAQTLASAVPGSSLQEDPAVGGAIELVLGPEFNGNVQQPTAGQLPPIPATPSATQSASTICSL